MAKYKEQVDLYVADKALEAMRDDKDRINSGEPLKEVILAYEREGEEFDITDADVNISIKRNNKKIWKERDEKYIVVYKGETYYVKSDKTNMQNKKQSGAKMQE